ncbi:phospholipase A2 inhibitor and Ly6/PLAUR domain-containing protein-like [Hyla sarda]|uniref:phospholipase A2 inhibitor and Ly6/PLAUR domain-containing protein-like n=1 Tax=Hyla sarda TaxID=327740 RepID=UPI0024C23ABB|nr:phospholipase A2 inhibitor and Ly6/PLAUR domain-containing protein-like [Hyla sarda]
MNNAGLLLPFILSSLVSTTFSLSCMECTVQGEKQCQGPSVTCPAEFDACVATLESNTKDGKDVTYRQYCGKRSTCSYGGTLTTNLGVKRVSSSCCFMNNCSPPMPKLPTEKTDKNGVSCKACSEEKGTTCEPSTTIECTGDEKECVSMTVTNKGLMSSSALRGCGTATWCSVKDRELLFGGQITEVSITCSGGHTALPPGLPLMLLAAIFIIKVIY